MIDVSKLLETYAEERSPEFVVSLPAGERLTFRHYQTKAHELQVLEKAKDVLQAHLGADGELRGIPSQWETAIPDADAAKRILPVAVCMAECSQDGLDMGVFVMLSRNAAVWNMIEDGFDAYQREGLKSSLLKKVMDEKKECPKTDSGGTCCGSAETCSESTPTT